jgi:hypothetical protein
MVAAVSSQAATVNPLAYTAQTDEENTQQAAVDATASDTDRGPATVITMSPEARAAESAFFAKIDQINQRRVASHEEMQRSFAAADEEMRDNVAVWLKDAQDRYNKWQSATPVPAMQLTETQIADVLKKAASLGYDPSKMGGADTYGFGTDGKIYIFKKDGTAWMNDDGVPTSEQQKRDVLATMANNIQFLTNYLRNGSPSSRPT